MSHWIKIASEKWVSNHVHWLTWNDSSLLIRSKRWSAALLLSRSWFGYYFYTIRYNLQTLVQDSSDWTMYLWILSFLVKMQMLIKGLVTSSGKRKDVSFHSCQVGKYLFLWTNIVWLSNYEWVISNWQKNEQLDVGRLILFRRQNTKQTTRPVTKAWVAKGGTRLKFLPLSWLMTLAFLGDP